MKTISLFILIVFGALLSINSQNYVLENNENSKEPIVTFFNAVEDYSYQFNVLGINKEKFSCAFNVRVEDELTSEANYKLFREVSFFDVNLSYTFNVIELNLTLENLLGINNNNFAIEPNLEEGIGNMQNILFTHEPDFLVSARIAYNF